VSGQPDRNRAAPGDELLTLKRRLGAADPRLIGDGVELVDGRLPIERDSGNLGSDPLKAAARTTRRDAIGPKDAERLPRLHERAGEDLGLAAVGQWNHEPVLALANLEAGAGIAAVGRVARGVVWQGRNNKGRNAGL
jgi:hypothetical protein